MTLNLSCNLPFSAMPSSESCYDCVDGRSCLSLGLCNYLLILSILPRSKVLFLGVCVFMCELNSECLDYGGRMVPKSRTV